MLELFESDHMDIVAHFYNVGFKYDWKWMTLPHHLTHFYATLSHTIAYNCNTFIHVLQIKVELASILTSWFRPPSSSNFPINGSWSLHVSPLQTKRPTLPAYFSQASHL